MNQDNRETSIIKKDNSELEQSNKNEVSTTVNFNGGKGIYVKEADNVNNTINAKITINNNGNNDKNTSENKKKRLKRLICIIPIAVVLIVTIIIVYKLYQYNSFSNEAQIKYKNGNYIEASELYHKASSYALTSNQYNSSKVEEGYTGISEVTNNTYEDDSSQKGLILSNSFNCFDSVIKKSSNNKSRHYYEAIAGKCDYYHLIDSSVDNEDWTNNINELEEYAKNLELDDDDPKDISHGGRIFYALSIYYSKLTRSTLNNFTDIDNSSKLLEYSTKHHNYFTKYKDKHHLPYSIDTSLLLELDLIKLGINDESILYTGNDKLIFYANSLENILNDIKENNLNVKPSTLYQINYTLGENYSVIFIYSVKRPIVDEYKQKAYDILSKLLYMSPEIGLSHYIGVGYYCARTCLCTDEDLHQIIENYRTYFSTISLQNNNAEYIHNALSAIYTCAFISIAYNNHTESDAYALQLTEQLLQQSSQIDSKSLDTIQNYYNYFSNNGGDISQEVKLYHLINLN